MPNVVILEGMLDLEKLHRVFMQLIRRHESLRTSFLEIDQKPVQRIHNQVEFEIQYLATKGHHSSFSIHHSFIRPFDLSRPPLLRVGVIGLAEDKHIFMADMHHIISDGISQQVLVREFVQLYQGEELPALRLQYRDFSRWRNQQTVLSEMKKQEAYWIKEFAGEVPLLTLPTDFPRPGFRRFEGNHARFTIESRETGKLKTLAQNREATLLMVIFALFNVLLSKLSRQEDIVLGTIIAGRPHPDLETIIGIFINILAIRTFPAPHKSFKTYLKEVKEKIINGFDHRDYQFEDLVDRVVSRRDPSRNPLFDVMFTFTPANTQSQSPAEEPRLGRESALKVKDYQGKLYQAKFDMLLSGTETKDQLVFNIEYSTSLFKPETIERFIDYFKQIVTAAVDDENKILKDIIVTHDLEHIKTDVYKSGESHFDF